MKKLSMPFDFGEIAAISTWATVFAITLYVMNTNAAYSESIVLVSAFFIVYLLCFFALGDTLKIELSAQQKLAILIIMLATTYGMLWHIPASFLSILTVIWVAVLVHFVSIRTSLIITVFVILTWFGLYSWKWPIQNIWFSAALYGTFHFFSILMAHQTLEAQQAKQSLERLNSELLATQDLVQQASRQQERTRIARDLHDLIGHHLTALIINLEVAKHQSEGAARDQITQSHALAKLLLSDVREAISEIRANESININSLVELWRSYIPNMTINTAIDEQITWHDLVLTQTVSFCILEALTNSMRHANASVMDITIKQLDARLVITLADNGTVKNDFAYGNGLQGMKERLEEIQGTLETAIVDGHLQLTLNVPSEVVYDH